MEVRIEHLGAVQFQITAREHKIACDQLEENGGFDEGMTLLNCFSRRLEPVPAFTLRHF
jgi:hypothetical protein